MQLTLRRASALMGIDEATLQRWIENRQLPVHYAEERPYIHPLELWEWAVEQGIPVPRSLLEVARKRDDPVLLLSELLTTGGVHIHVDGRDKRSVLTAIADRLPLPSSVDRQALLFMLEAREAMGSTGIGDGVAIPHVRNPIVLHVEQPFVSLFLLRHAIDFDAIDGLPVRALFVVVSPNIPLHLQILARLGHILHDASLRALLHAGAATEVVDRVRVLEAASIDPRTTTERPR